MEVFLYGISAHLALEGILHLHVFANVLTLLFCWPYFIQRNNHRKIYTFLNKWTNILEQIINLQGGVKKYSFY